MDGNSIFVSTRGLVKEYPAGLSKFTALKDIDIDIRRGEFMGLVGPSGSGKTTLLNIIGALDNPSGGSASVMNEKVEDMSHSQSAALRNRYLGFIFQTYNLLPVYTVYENVEFPLLLLKLDAGQRRKMVMDALDWVGLTEKIKSKPKQLSGGESQRVAIARAMVKKPQIVLADEPTANLDAKNSFNILDTMKKLNKELQTTFIFATHDDKVIKYLDRIVTLIDGKIAEDRIVERS